MIQGSDLTWSKSLPKAREKGKNTSVWPDLECVDFCRVSHESNLWVKYRVVRHPLVAMTWRPNHWTKLDKWGLGWKLDTWRYICIQLFARPFVSHLSLGHILLKDQILRWLIFSFSWKDNFQLWLNVVLCSNCALKSIMFEGGIFWRQIIFLEFDSWQF